MALNYEEYDKSITLVQRISLMLRKRINDGEYEVGSQLPNEIELAREFRASRGTIRAALQILEQSGLVIKKRGIGTFVSKEPMLINNLSMNFGISQVIASIDAVPGTDYINVYTTTMDDSNVTSRLELQKDATLLVIERVRTANGKRVAFTQDIFGLTRFYELTHTDSTDALENYLKTSQSLYSFLSAKLEYPIHHAISHLLPMQCEDKKMTDLLGISDDSVLLYIEQVDYTADGNPIWMAKEYHIPDMFTFSVYRMM